jgi:hypothetical protein
MEADLAAFLAARQAQDGDVAVGSISVAGAVERRAERAQNAFNRALNGSAGITEMAKSDRETLAKLAELEIVVRRDSIAARLAAVKGLKAAS